LQGALGDTELKLESAKADLAEADAKLATIEVRGSYELLDGWTLRKRDSELAVIVHETQIAEIEKALDKAEREALDAERDARLAEAPAIVRSRRS